MLYGKLLVRLSAIILVIAVPMTSVALGEMIATNKLIVSILSVITVNFIFLLLYRVFCRREGSSSWTDPVVIIVVSYSLYELAYPLDVCRGVINEFPIDDVVSTLRLYIIANFALLGGVLFVELLSRWGKKYKRPFTRIESATKSRTLWRVSIVFLCIGIALMCMDEVRMGGLSVLGVTNRLKNFQAQISLAGSALTLPWKEIISASLIVMAQSARSKKQYRLLGITVGFLSLFFLMGLGSRTYVFMCMFPPLAVLVDRRLIRVTTLRSFMAMCFILLMLSPWFTNYRNYLIQGIDPSSLPASAWAFSRGELGGQFRVAVQIFLNGRWWPGADPSYLTAVLYSLPRPLYIFLTGHPKPMDLADWFAATYYTYMWSHTGVGWGFSPVIQAWMNGGSIAISVVFALLGILTRSVVGSKWFGYVLTPQLIWFNRVDFHSFFYEVLLVSLVVLIVTHLSKVIDERRERATDHQQQERKKANRMSNTTLQETG